MIVAKAILLVSVAIIVSAAEPPLPTPPKAYSYFAPGSAVTPLPAQVGVSASRKAVASVYSNKDRSVDDFVAMKRYWIFSSGGCVCSTSGMTAARWADYEFEELATAKWTGRDTKSDCDKWMVDDPSRLVSFVCFDGSTPVYEVWYSEAVLPYQNFTEGEPDAALFNLPAACHKAKCS